MAQNSQGLQSPHCYLQDFLITFILQQQVVSKWLRACAMNWAWKQWNSLSKSSITNSKHKPQARQKIFFFLVNTTKQKDINLYTSPPNLNQTLSSMLKMILSNICLQWKESKILTCNMRKSSRKSKVRRRRRCTLIKLIVINFNFC